MITHAVIFFSRLHNIYFQIMNSNVPDLSTIILNLLNQHAVFSSNEDESMKEETTVGQDNNRRYYFIVFNNPRWSTILNKRKAQVRIIPHSFY